MLSSNAMQLDHCQRPDVTYLLHHQAAHTLANKQDIYIYTMALMRYLRGSRKPENVHLVNNCNHNAIHNDFI